MSVEDMPLAASHFWSVPPPASLFLHFREELRRKESELNTQAEDKKEELRQLVGRRYRLLIDTADSIMHMKESSHQGIRNLTEISKVLTKLRHRPKEDEEDISLISEGQLQVQLKRQYEIPELLWQDLSSDSFLQACERLTEASNLQDRLKTPVVDEAVKAKRSTSAPSEKMDLQALYPLFLSQQRVLLQPFTARILQHARRRLYTPRLPVAVYSEALRAMAKLQSEASNEQMLKTFLSVRSSWIEDGLSQAQQILKMLPDAKNSTFSQNGASGPDPTPLLCTALGGVAYTLRATIFHAATLFASSSSIAYLQRPNNATSPLLPAPSPLLQSRVGTCRDAVLAELAAGPAGADKRFLSEMGVALTQLSGNISTDEKKTKRESLAAELAREAQVAQKEWRVACMHVLPGFSNSAEVDTSGGRVVVSLWKELYVQAFSKRSKELIDQSFGSLQLDSYVAEALSKSDKKDAKQEDREVASELSYSSNSSSWSASGLWEEEVETICSKCNRDLSALVEDTRLLLHSAFLQQEQAPVQDPAQSDKESRGTGGGLYLFSASLRRFLTDDLLFFAQTKCTQAFSRSVSAVKKQLNTLQAAVLDAAGPAGAANASSLADRAVFVGRVFRRLACHATALQQIVTLAPEPQNARVEQSSPAVGVASQARLSFVQQSLLGTAQQAFRIWTRVVAQELADSLHRSLRVWLLRGKERPETVTTLWSKVNGEAGIDLPLPCRPSRHVLPLAFELVRHLSRVYGHQVETETVGLALLDVTDALLSTMQDLATPDAAGSALPEHLCLQLLFDTQCLFSLLRLPATSGASVVVDAAETASMSNSSSALRNTLRPRYATLLSTLEDGVDPINYSVSRKHLNQRVHDVLRNSSVL
eukprot:g50483.t1